MIGGSGVSLAQNHTSEANNMTVASKSPTTAKEGGGVAVTLLAETFDEAEPES